MVEVSRRAATAHLLERARHVDTDTVPCRPGRPALQSAHADFGRVGGPMKRSVGIAAAAGLVLAGTVALTMAPASAATTGCRAVYSVPNQWPGGFIGSVTVTNLGDPIANWVITWDFPAGQQLVSGWNATWSQSGAHVSAAAPPFSGGPLGTGASVTVG